MILLLSVQRPPLPSQLFLRWLSLIEVESFRRNTLRREGPPKQRRKQLIGLGRQD